MRKIILILAILFLSCEAEPIKETCICEKQYYDRYNEHQYLFSEVADKKYCDGSEQFFNEKSNQIYKYVLVCE
jgi:hypothetical protein